MQHSLPEHLVAGLVGRAVAVCHILAVIVHTKLFRHQAKQEVDIAALPKQECEFGFLKRGQEATGEVFPFNRRNADGGILGDAAAEDRKEGFAVVSGQCRGRSRADAEIERGGNV